MTATISFIAGLIIGAGLGIIVTAVTIHDSHTKEMYDDCYIQENDM